MVVEGDSTQAFSMHPNDEHLKAVTFHNFGNVETIGTLRIETGIVTVPMLNSAAGSATVTFSKPFRRILTLMGNSHDSNYFATRSATISNSSGTLLVRDVEQTVRTININVDWIAIGVD